MKKKLFILFTFILLFSAVAVMPAFASCDDCIASTENIDWSDHCEAHCTCEWDVCGSCGDGGTYLDVFCGKTHEYSSKVTKAATCTQTGIRTYTCDCGKSYTETIAALQHSYQTSVIAASCESDGYTLHKCSRCDYSYKSNTTPATGHSMAETSRVDATCTQKGTIYYKCKNCTATTTSSIAEKGHSWRGYELVPPTCTKNGYYLDICNACDEERTEGSVPATGHTSRNVSTTAPTCTASGVVKRECSVCGEALADEKIDPLGHNYVSTVVEPTCDAGGYTRWDCSRCDDCYLSDETDPVDHSFQEDSRDEPTCVKKGTIYYVCSACGETSTDSIDTVPHTWVSAGTNAPTCTEDGAEYFRCSVCGASDTAPIEAPGHDWRGYETVSPTCTDDGYYYDVCNVCDEIDTWGSIPATGHNLKQVKVMHQTCTTSGSIDYECTVCGYETSTILNKLGHDFCEVEVIAPTCTSKGYTRKGCSRCDEYQVVAGTETAMVDHEYGDPYYSAKFSSGYGRDCVNCNYYEDLVPDVCTHTNRQQKDGTYVAPTCTEKGYVTLVCTDCNYEWLREYSASGHTWSDPYYSIEFSTGYGHECTVCKYIEDLQAPNCTHENREPIDGSDLPATCTAPGYISYKCLDCEKTWQETINALGHTWSDPYYSNAFSTGYGHKCTVCEYLEELGVPECSHQNREPIDGSYAPATCTAPGYISYKCLDCEKTWQETIPILPHTWSDPYYSNAFSTGYGHKCTVCEYIEELEVPECSHENREPIDGSYAPATCTAPGYINYKCLDCEKTWQETIAALGHDHSVGVVVPPVSCKEKGYTYYKCSRDGCTSYIVDASSYVVGDHVPKVISSIAATCVSDGLNNRECSLCGTALKDEVVPATGHNYCDPVVIPAKCTEIGFTLVQCLNAGCNKTIKSDEVAALGHDYVDGVCSRCQAVQPTSPSQSVHEHIWNTVEIIKATCEADGQTVQECSCGAKKTTPIKKLGHKWSEPVVTAPTCTKGGSTRIYCLNGCGKEQITDLVSALGHEYTDGICVRCHALEKLPETTAPSEPDDSGDGKEDDGSTGDSEGNTIFDGLIDDEEDLTPLFLRYLGMVIFFIIIFAALAPDPKKRKRRRRRR